MVKYPTEATIVQHRVYSLIGRVKYFLGLSQNKYDNLTYEVKFSGYCSFDFYLEVEKQFNKNRHLYDCDCKAYSDALLRTGFERVSTGTRRDGYLLKNYHLQNIIDV